MDGGSGAAASAADGSDNNAEAFGAGHVVVACFFAVVIYLLFAADGRQKNSKHRRAASNAPRAAVPIPIPSSQFHEMTKKTSAGNSTRKQKARSRLLRDVVNNNNNNNNNSATNAGAADAAVASARDTDDDDGNDDAARKARCASSSLMWKNASAKKIVETETVGAAAAATAPPKHEQVPSSSPKVSTAAATKNDDRVIAQVGATAARGNKEDRANMAAVPTAPAVESSPAGTTASVAATTAGMLNAQRKKALKRAAQWEHAAIVAYLVVPAADSHRPAAHAKDEEEEQLDRSQLDVILYEQLSRFNNAAADTSTCSRTLSAMGHLIDASARLLTDLNVLNATILSASQGTKDLALVHGPAIPVIDMALVGNVGETSAATAAESGSVGARQWCRECLLEIHAAIINYSYLCLKREETDSLLNAHAWESGIVAFVNALPGLFRPGSTTKPTTRFSVSDAMLKGIVAAASNDGGDGAETNAEVQTLFEPVVKRVVDHIERDLGVNAAVPADIGAAMPLAMALVHLCRIPGIADCLAVEPRFVQKALESPLSVTTRVAIEQNTVLGLLVRSCVNVEAALFPDGPPASPLSILRVRGAEQKLQSCRDALNEYHAVVVALFSRMLNRQAPRARQGCLWWMRFVVRRNRARRQMNYATGLVSSDGFLLALTRIFVELNNRVFSKRGATSLASGTNIFDGIDMGFILPRSSGCVAFDEDQARVACTKRLLHATSAVMEEKVRASHDDGKSHASVMTECFFVTHELVRISLRKSFQAFFKMHKAVIDNRRALLELQSTGQTQSMHFVERHLADAVRGVQQLGVWLNDREGLLDKLVIFLELTSTWFLRVTGSSPSSNIITSEGDDDVALSEESMWRAIPEFIFENIKDVSLSLARLQPWTVEHVREDGRFASPLVTSDKSWEVLVGALLRAVAGPCRIRNPHLRGEMMDAFSLFMPPKRDVKSNSQFHSLRLGRANPNHPFFSSHALQPVLVPALMELFVSIDHGQHHHGAYYLKFKPRSLVADALHYLLDHELHREQLVTLASSDKRAAGADNTVFELFAHGLLGDMGDGLSDGMEALRSLVQVEKRADESKSGASRAAGESLGGGTGGGAGAGTGTVSTRENMQNMQNARWWLGYVTAGLRLFSHMTEVDGIPAALLCRLSLVKRMASVVFGFVDQLASKDKVRAVLLRDRDRVGFSPRELLTYVCRIVGNLGGRSEGSEQFLQNVTTFVKQVSHQGRREESQQDGYSAALFVKCRRIMANKKCLSTHELGRLGVALERMISDAESLMEEEQAYADCPPEYCCPITADIMEDPVVLPCGKVMDRASLDQCLLQDPVNPFTRKPMVMSDARPNTKLAEEIRRWKAAALNAWRKEHSPTAAK